MITLFITYIGSLITLVCLDLLWLGIIARDFYQEHLGHLLSGKVDWMSAVLFYIIYTAGVYFFAISRAQSTKELLLLSAAFGFVAYATYDLTNGATLKNWPYIVTLVDIIWGMVITTIVGLVGYYIKTHL